MSKTPPANYRGAVRIRGAATQLVYGSKHDTVARRCIKLLTAHPPGWASCTPIAFDMFKKEGDAWRLLMTMTYEECT